MRRIRSTIILIIILTMLLNAPLSVYAQYREIQSVLHPQIEFTNQPRAWINNIPSIEEAFIYFDNWRDEQGILDSDIHHSIATNSDSHSVDTSLMYHTVLATDAPIRNISNRTDFLESSSVTTGDFILFGDLEAPDPDPTCDAEDTTVGQDHAQQALFIQSCLNAGGFDVIGNLEANDSAADNIQTFTNGSLVYNGSVGAVYYVPNDVIDTLNADAAWFQEELTSVIVSDAPPHGLYKDENNNFLNSTFYAFGENFIAFDSVNGMYESHKPYPEIEQIEIEYKRVIIGGEWVDDPDDPDPSVLILREIYGTQLTFIPIYELNGDDLSDYVEYIAVSYGGGLYESWNSGDDPLTIIGPSQLNNEYAEATNGFRDASIIDFHFAITRYGPDFPMTSYMPCNYYVEGNLPDIQWELPDNLVINEFPASDSIPNTCDASTINPDNEPPTIELTQIYNTESGDGITNDLAIQALVQDNVMVTEVWFVYDGGTFPMTAYDVDGAGNGIYEFIIENANLNEAIIFTIIAIDGAGNQAEETYQFPNGVISRLFGPHGCLSGCGADVARDFRLSQGNPVTTDIGNKVEQFTLLSYPGTSGSAIALTVTINAMDMNEGVFGASTTSLLDASLGDFDNSLFVGARVTYPDGHSADFAKIDECVYEVVSPTVYDTLICGEEDGYVLTTVHRMVYTFDDEGKIISIGDLNDNKVEIIYEGEQAVQILSDSTRYIDLVYENDLIVELIGSDGRVVSMNYTDSRLDGYLDANGGQWEFTYVEGPLDEVPEDTTLVDNHGEIDAIEWYLLTDVITPEGRTKNHQEYDDDARVIFQQIGETETYTFEYSESGDTSITDANGNTVIHHYDAFGRLLSVIDARGNTKTYIYEPSDSYIRAGYIDERGNVWRYETDQRGNILSFRGPLGFEETYTYNDFNQRTSYTDAEGHTSLFIYDDLGNLIGIQDAQGNTQTITNNERGQAINIVDFSGRETRFDYDEETGDLLAQIDGEGYRTEMIYNDAGLIASITNPNDNSYFYFYDNNLNITRIEGPSAWFIERSYDADNLLTKERDPNGGFINMTYDGSGRLVGLCDPMNYCVSYEYEPMGNLQVITDPLGRSLYFSFNENYDIAQTTAPEAVTSTIEYDETGNVISVIDPLGRVTKTAFDALNRPVEVVNNFIDAAPQNADTNVNTIFSYDLVDNLVSIMDAKGNSTLYFYNELNQLVGSADALGRVWQFGYLPTGEISSITNPRSNAFTMYYDNVGQLIQDVNPLGETTTYNYDGNGNLVNIRDARAVLTHFDYNELDQLTTITENYLSGEAEDSETNVITRFELDLLGNISREIDPRGHTTTMNYDANSRLIRVIDRENANTIFAYDAVGNIIGILDGNGHSTAFGYDDLDRLVEVVNPENHIQQYSYDAVSNLTTFTNERGFEQTFSYDALNRPIELIDFANGVWSFEYDRVGNILVETDANRHSTHYDYNAVYERIQSIDPKGIARHYEYDAMSNLITFVDGNVETSRFAYDALDRLSWHDDQLERRTRFGYDEVGNQIQQTAPDNVVTAFRFDPLNRLADVTENAISAAISTEDINVTTGYDYDRNGNIVTMTNPLGNIWSFDYDAENRTTREVDPINNTWEYGYDAVGNQISYLDGKDDFTEYDYYPDNMLEKVRYPDGSGVLYSYDEANNLLRMEEPGRLVGTSSWIYDALNRVTYETDGLGRSISAQYDPVSNRIGLTYPDGRVQNYSYDANDWLETVTVPEQGTTYYSYNNEGFVTSIAYPNDTLTSQSYDAANQVINIRSEQLAAARKIISESHYTYNLAGMRTEVVQTYGFRQPSIVIFDYDYDPLRRLVNTENTPGITTSYEYDAAGNRTHWETSDDPMTNKPADDFVEDFSYNAANQLLGTVRNYGPPPPPNGNNGNGGNDNNGNNNRGNGATPAEPGQPGTPAVPAIPPNNRNNGSDTETPEPTDDAVSNNHLNYVATFEYDGNGSRTQGIYDYPHMPSRGAEYEYDYERRLINVQPFMVNGNGRRHFTGGNEYIYDSQGTLLAELNTNSENSPNFRTEFVSDGWDIIGSFELLNDHETYLYRDTRSQLISSDQLWSGTGTDEYYYYDALGSVMGTTNHQGTGIHTYRYDSYGALIPSTEGNLADTPHNAFTYSGKPYDDQSNLIFYGSRHYDPLTAQWLQQDHYRGNISVPQSLNRYGFVHGSPTNYVDVYGYVACDKSKGIEDGCTTGSDETNTLFINGVTAEYDGDDSHIDRLEYIEEVIGNDVTGLYNKTDGGSDWFQAIGDKYNTKNTNQATGELMKEIKKRLDNGKPITLIGHSQGGIIVANALIRLEKNGVDISNVRAILIGAPVEHFSKGGRYALIYHQDDSLAKKCGLFSGIPDNVKCYKANFEVSGWWLGKTGPAHTDDRLFDMLAGIYNSCWDLPPSRIRMNPLKQQYYSNQVMNRMTSEQQQDWIDQSYRNWRLRNH